MTAKITYFKLEDLSEGDNNQSQAWVEGTRAEILLTSPTSPAIGKASDSTYPMSFLPGVGWSEGSKLSTDGQSVQFAQKVFAPNLQHSIVTSRAKGVLIGTSSVANAYNTVAGVKHHTNKSPWDIANAALGTPWQIVPYGFSGQNNAVLLGNLPSILAAERPDFLIWMGGPNDLSNVASTAVTAFADTLAAKAICDSYGVAFILKSPHAKIGSVANYKSVSLYGRMCADWALANRIVHIDAARLITNRLDKVMTAKTNALTDELHYGSLGANLVADGIISQYQSGMYSKRWIAPCGNAENSAEIFDNPSFIAGGGGGTKGSGITGTVPDTWNVTQYGGGSTTAVCSVGTDSDGAYFDIAVTSAAANDGITLVCSTAGATLNARINPAKSYRVGFDAEVLSGNACISRVSNECGFSAGSFQSPFGSGSTYNGLHPVRRIQHFTELLPPSAIGTITSTLGIRLATLVGGSATGTVRIRGLSFHEAIA